MFSQSYGNEWISPNQKYFKITLNNKGIYRIDYFNLISAATEMRLDLSTVNPKKWQIFHNGIEIPIYVAGEQDNIFNSSDFIEFYSTPNDGKLDNDLYGSPDYNANPSSMLSALESFISNTQSNKLAIIGDMLELGKESRIEHAKILDFCLNNKLNFITIGLIFKEINPKGYASVSDFENVIDLYPLNNFSILLKGSRGIALEKLIPKL
jgi:hypothetical protein